jgi:putative salt-induced outer membrane protein
MASDVSQDELKKEIAQSKADAKALAKKIKKLEAQLPPNENLITHTELGYIQTQGNTQTETFNLDLGVKKGWKRHLLKFSFDAQYALDKGVETKNKYATELEYAYSLSERLSATYLVGFKKDKFSGFDYQAYTGPGLKYLVLKNKKHNLTIDGSILYSQDDEEDTNYDAAGNVIDYPNPDNIATASTTYGPVNNYTSYRAKGVYTWQILQNLKFDQDLSYRARFSDSTIYFVTSKTAFSSKINSIFSAGISYKVDYVNSPPSDKETADRTFTANLIIDY